MSKTVCRYCKNNLGTQVIELIPGGSGGLKYGPPRYDGLKRVIWAGNWCSPDCLAKELNELLKE